MALGGRADYSDLHGPGKSSTLENSLGPRWFLWFLILVVLWAMDINTDLSSDLTMDLHMVFGSILGLDVTMVLVVEIQVI